MKILYFHQHFSTPSGAVGIRSYEMAKRLLHHGHEVTMVCGSYSGGRTGLTGPFQKGMRKGVVDGITVIEFNLSYANTDGFVKRAATFLKFSLRSIIVAFREQYDIVFATTTPLTAGIPAILARWLRRKPFVFEVRDLWPELPKAMGVISNPIILWLMSMLEWISYHSANRCIGLSPGIVKGIVKRGIDKDKVTLIPNGCDLSIFDQPVSAWRPQGVADTDLMAVFTGTHGIANGLDAVLDAAVELKKRNRGDVKLVLVGQGKLKAQLQKRAKTEQLDNVIFHDPVAKKELSGLLKSADIGLQILANVPAFYYGTSPNKFFDYISAGLPVLNNYPGWLSEMIEARQCGYNVEPGDAIAFADALAHAADNREGLVDMGKSAKQLAKEQFNRHDLANQWVQWVTATK
ncbi:MAG: glycosyltransferase WbuB [Gammaproteobacteria bacterium]|nr:MAG: glycosyltransferase WbuB [Gammaproteobacteria bacterium]